MALGETIQILIDADSSGLETQLKRSSTNIISFIDKMNDQQINWSTILAGALDTSLIAGVAATFAQAISQAVSFQNTLLDVSNNTSTGTSGASNALDQLSGSIANLSGQTGAGPTETAQAYEALYKQFNNSSDAASALTGEIGQLALVSNQNLSDLLPKIIDLFNQWGIDTLPAAQSALTGLINEAGQGKFSLNELISSITDQGPILSTKTNITNLAAGMQSLSENTNLSKTTIVSAMSSIATAVQNPLSTINLLAPQVALKIGDGPGGLVEAFGALSKAVQKFGPEVGPTLAAQFGLSTTAAKQLQDATTSAFSSADTSAVRSVANLKSFQSIIDANLSSSDRLAMAWSKFQAELVGPGTVAVQSITGYLIALNTIITTIGTGIDSFTSKFQSFSQLTQYLKTGGIGVPSTGTSALSPSISNLATGGLNTSGIGLDLIDAFSKLQASNTTSSSGNTSVNSTNSNVSMSNIFNISGPGLTAAQKQALSQMNNYLQFTGNSH